MHKDITLDKQFQLSNGGNKYTDDKTYMWRTIDNG